MTTQDSRDIVEQYVAALSAKDVTRIFALLNPQAVYVVPGDSPLSGRHVGHQDIATNFLLPMSQQFDPDAAYDVETLAVISEGARTVVQCVTTATVADGTPYRNEIVAIFTVENDSIVSIEEYFDTQEFAKLTAVSS